MRRNTEHYIFFTTNLVLTQEPPFSLYKPGFDPNTVIFLTSNRVFIQKLFLFYKPAFLTETVISLITNPVLSHRPSFSLRTTNFNLVVTQKPLFSLLQIWFCHRDLHFLGNKPGFDPEADLQTWFCHRNHHLLYYKPSFASETIFVLGIQPSYLSGSGKYKI